MKHPRSLPGSSPQTLNPGTRCHEPAPLLAASSRMAHLVPKQLLAKRGRGHAAPSPTKGSCPEVNAHLPGHGITHNSTGPPRWSNTVEQIRES